MGLDKLPGIMTYVGTLITLGGLYLVAVGAKVKTNSQFSDN